MPTLSSCVSLTFFHLGTELTENPLSKCVPLCCPTWVQGVIPVTGAPSHAGVPQTDFTAFCTRWIILTDFRCTTVFPKNQSRRAPRISHRLDPLSRFHVHVCGQLSMSGLYRTDSLAMSCHTTFSFHAAGLRLFFVCHTHTFPRTPPPPCNRIRTVIPPAI